MTVQRDPKRFGDTIGGPPQPTENAIIFWTAYEGEAARYDKAFVEKHGRRLNITTVMVFVYLAIGLGLVRLQSGFGPDPDSRTEALRLLEAILTDLNPARAPVAPPVQEAPSQIDPAFALFYIGSFLCLLAAFLALSAKRCLSSYLQPKGGPLIERCMNRQRKFNVLKKWRFDLFLKSPMVTTLIALPLLICGLCQRTCHLDSSVLYILVLLAVPGVVFGSIVIASPSEFATRPHKLPSTPLSKFWKGSITR